MIVSYNRPATTSVSTTPVMSKSTTPKSGGDGNGGQPLGGYFNQGLSDDEDSIKNNPGSQVQGQAMQMSNMMMRMDSDGQQQQMNKMMTSSSSPPIETTTAPISTSGTTSTTDDGMVWYDKARRRRKKSSTTTRYPTSIPIESSSSAFPTSIPPSTMASIATSTPRHHRRRRTKNPFQQWWDGQMKDMNDNIEDMKRMFRSSTLDAMFTGLVTTPDAVQMMSMMPPQEEMASDKPAFGFGMGQAMGFKFGQRLKQHPEEATLGPPMTFPTTSGPATQQEPVTGAPTTPSEGQGGEMSQNQNQNQDGGQMKQCMNGMCQSMDMGGGPGGSMSQSFNEGFNKGFQQSMGTGGMGGGMFG